MENPEEEIYMQQPVGFILQGQEDKFCKLKKSIYRLIQSSRQRYLRFHTRLISYNFVMINKDYCVYVKHSKNCFVFLSLYVDDILLAKKNK